MTVSIIMLTYNHEKFIAQAIEGVLSQEVSFPIELIIADDKSTDRTTEIVASYRSENAGLIKGFCNEQNLGPSANFVKAFSGTSGDYIALCEGDDYWTDPFKLQKQVDFLNANPEYSLCVHGFDTVTEQNQIVPERSFIQKNASKTGFEVTIDLFFRQWVTQTLTTMFRKSAVTLNFSDYALVSDTILFFNLLKNGKGYWMNFNGGCYRVHSGGFWSSLSVKKGLLTSYEVLADLLHGNRDTVPLREALANKVRQILDYDMDSNNKTEFSLNEVLFFSRRYLQLNKSKKEALAYIRRHILKRILVLSKMAVRMKFDRNFREGAGI